MGMFTEYDNLEAVLYARVSDNRSGRSRSVEQQLDAGRHTCAQRGIPIAKEIIDDDKGASRYSRAKRDGYEQIIEHELRPSRPGVRRVLVTWESSRAQRDLEVYVQLRKACEQTGALWCYDGRFYDMRDPDDRYRTGQDALDDEKEVERTRKRVRRDLAANAEAGRPHGKLAYGYRIVRDERTGRALERVPDPETAPIVREIADRVLSGEPLRAIATDLNRRGIPAPRPKRKGPRKGEAAPWIGPTVRSLIKSPTYAGLRTVRGVVIREGTWPAILTREQHERINALFADPKRCTQRGSEPVWLLSFIALCGECGSHIVRIKAAGRGNYICGGKFCVSRTVAWLEPLVSEAVIQRLESPDVVALLARGDKDASAAYDEARALRERLDAFVDQAADGELSPAALARIEARLRPQIAAAERRARASIASPLVARVAGPHARRMWDDELTMPEKRELVRALVEVRIFRGAHRALRNGNPNLIHLRWVNSDEPIPTGPPEIAALADGGDPMNFTVPEVLAYLRGVDDDERRRVVAAERAGKARPSLLQVKWVTRDT